MVARASLRNLAMISSGVANDCSLPRGASRVSLATEPSPKWMSTRTLCPERRAERGDGGMVHDLDLARERDAPLIVDRFGLELLDEHVALDQQRRDAEGEVELRRGQPFRPVRPADVIDRHLRAVDDDAVELGERERAPAGNVADGVERGVVAAHAGIELERDAHGLEALA